MLSSQGAPAHPGDALHTSLTQPQGARHRCGCKCVRADAKAANTTLHTAIARRRPPVGACKRRMRSTQAQARQHTHARTTNPPMLCYAMVQLQGKS